VQEMAFIVFIYIFLTHKKMKNLSFMKVNLTLFKNVSCF